MKRIRYLALIAGMTAALMAAPVIAAGDDYVIDPGHPGSITINYRDSIDGDDPIAGAEFTYYRVTGFDSAMSKSNVGLAFPTLLKDKKGNPIVVSSKSDPEKVRKKVQNAYERGTPEGGVIYKAVTDSSGRAVTESMAQGIYLAVETKPAKEHLASSPFFVVLPYTHGNKWNYDITADPKPIPCGDLTAQSSGIRTKGMNPPGQQARYRMRKTASSSQQLSSVSAVIPDGQRISQRIRKGPGSVPKTCTRWVPPGFTAWTAGFISRQVRRKRRL